MVAEIALPLATVAASCALTGWHRSRALRVGMLDIPNERSSHVQPTPRGGGIAIVISTLCAALLSWYFDSMDSTLLMVLLSGGLAVALVGYVDDRSSVGALPRFAVHVAAATWSVYHLGSYESGVFSNLGLLVGSSVLVLGVSWAINAFNFMDGIDGIAATELAFICTAAALLIFMQGNASTEATYLLCVAGAGAGFLIWNWSPARIFMGDVGSGFVGFLVGVLAIHSHLVGALSIWTWIVLASAFISDATVTLVRRVLQGERWYEAHRSHAYQHLSRRWRSHSRTVIAMISLNVGLLFPLAYWCESTPEYSPFIAFSALVMLALLCVLCGAGESESKSPGSKPKPSADSPNQSPC